MVELDGPWKHVMLYTRGLRLHVAHAGNPARPLLLLLHDAHGGWFDFQHTIAPLAERGFHVAAVDLRGYGLSDKPPASFGYSMRSLCGDVVGLIRSLGHDSAWVLGAGTGGAIAWCLAASYPQYLRGMISVSAGHPTDTRRVALRHPWAFRALWRPRDNARTGQELRRTARRISNTRHARERMLRLATRPVPRSWAGSGPAAVPVLCLRSEQSPWTLLDAPSRRRARASFQVSCVPGAGDLPQLEAPDALTEAVAAWIAQA